LQELFADTCYLIAIQRPKDSLHRRAVELSDKLFPQWKIVTSDLVIIETLNYFCGHGALTRESVFVLLSEFRRDSGIEVVKFSDELFGRAGKLYSQAQDKSWSFTDCSSFAIMHERGIHDALTYDHHFQQAGFRALLREDK
jgi:predicted nucleic acid-binding protein